MKNSQYLKDLMIFIGAKKRTKIKMGAGQKSGTYTFFERILNFYRLLASHLFRTLRKIFSK